MYDIKTDVSIIEVKDSEKADFICLHCNTYGAFIIENSKWKRFRNRNYDLILKKYPTLHCCLELCPEAIKFILDNIHAICCDKCGQPSLMMNWQSKFSPSTILTSLTIDQFNE